MEKLNETRIKLPHGGMIVSVRYVGDVALLEKRANDGTLTRPWGEVKAIPASERELVGIAMRTRYWN